MRRGCKDEVLKIDKLKIIKSKKIKGRVLTEI